MVIKAEQRFLRMSPQKLRLVVRAAKDIKNPEQLLTYLQFMQKRAALPIARTIKQAIANARNTAGITDALRVKEIIIGEGPRLKRWRAGPRGIGKPILKKTSHIRVLLESVEQPKEKKVVNEEKEGEKK